MKNFQHRLCLSVLAFIFLFSLSFQKPLTAYAADATQTTETEEAQTPESSTESEDIPAESGDSTEEGTTETEEETTEAEESTDSEEETTAAEEETTAEEDLSASDSTENTSKKTTKAKKEEEKDLEDWLDLCETLGDNLRKKNFRYSNSGTRSSYQSALSGARKSNCALYVSWCLQEFGALKKGQTFYVRRSGSIHKNFRKWGNKVKVIRVYRRCSSVSLEKGDVVCFSGVAHAAIYAGRSNSGERLWYDAGKSGTYSGHSGSHYQNVGKKTQDYLNRRTVSYIIRIKGL